MFTDEEPDFCQREYKSSILTMFMRIDRRFMDKCFGQMQELGIYPGQIPVLGLLAHKDGLSQREIAEKHAHQTTDCQRNCPTPGKSGIPLQRSR